MADKVTFDDDDNIVKIKTAECDYCGEEFRPSESFADDSEHYCSQSCEIADNDDDDFDED